LSKLQPGIRKLSNLISRLHSLATSRDKFFIAFAAALLIRFVASWLSHGTPVVDVHTFFVWAERFDEGQNPYTTSEPANYPPLWVFVCWCCLKASHVTGLSFDLWIKLFISTVDAASVWPIAWLVRAVAATDNTALRAAWGYAVNPVPILIAACHGQNDPVAIGLIIWAAWLFVATPGRFARALGMLLVGLSLTVKPIAVLFVPIFLASLPGWWPRVSGLAIAGLPSLAVWLPYLNQNPHSVLVAVTSYGGVPDFGYVGIFNSWCNLGHGSAGLPIVESKHIGWQFRAVWMALVAAAWWKKRAAELIEQLVWIVVCLYLVYGLLAAQYLMWLVPFAAAAGSRRLWRSSAWSAVTLFAFYQLHHPTIIRGGEFQRVNLPIGIPQWSGIFLIAHVMLYFHWLCWWWELAVPPGFWRRRLHDLGLVKND